MGALELHDKHCHWDICINSLLHLTLQQALVDFTWGGRWSPLFSAKVNESKQNVWSHAANKKLPEVQSRNVCSFQWGISTPNWWSLDSFLEVMEHSSERSRLSRWVDHSSNPLRQLRGTAGLFPGGRRGTRGNLPKTGSCSTPFWPNPPEGVPAAQLVTQWHVTNGDMLLLPCFVRLVALSESKTAGTSQNHMSAEKWEKGMQGRADSSAASANA